MPLDLEAQAKNSRFYRQLDPSKGNSVARPDALPNTDLTNAFDLDRTIGLQGEAFSVGLPFLLAPVVGTLLLWLRPKRLRRRSNT